jgi:uncharacterized protein YkwD
MSRLLIAVCLALVVHLASGPALARADARMDESSETDLVNQARQSSGLEPVIRSTALSASAQRYAEEMATRHFFSHVGLDGSSFVSRDEAEGYVHWVFIAEDIARGQPDAQSAVNAWLSSPPHRANILSPYVHEYGVGHVYSPDSPYHDYWVIELGAR